MPEPSRTASNYRNFGPEHVERLCFIRRAREIGFSIGEIKELLVLAEPGRASCAEVQTLTAAHLFKGANFKLMGWMAPSRHLRAKMVSVETSAAVCGSGRNSLQSVMA